MSGCTLGKVIIVVALGLVGIGIGIGVGVGLKRDETSSPDRERRAGRAGTTFST
jgi:hypothetical protein